MLLSPSLFFSVDSSHAREKAMVPHSSVLAWRTPGTGEPGGLLSMGLHRVRHDCSDLAAAAAAMLGFPGGSVVKNSPAVQETQVQLASLTSVR